MDLSRNGEFAGFTTPDDAAAPFLSSPTREFRNVPAPANPDPAGRWGPETFRGHQLMAVPTVITGAPAILPAFGY
ncbi:hypothetical protein MHIB_36940 [Mycolicibacter hiberniae]|uniref:Uncharacterized protein n=1 Tax=Mycolicibacter hiberniae TaxID=29314 RepID=A0A7I7X6D8_9MYCO|nr:hypothetical protein MHIB_36940 [Mycolicibacter hiberniae]